MWNPAIAVISAFGVMFVAELGDKTQLLALGFGARYGLRTVALGLTLGYATAGAAAALVGGVLGAALPERPIAIGAGVLFLVFAGLTLGERADDDQERVVDARNVVASIALTIVIAEMGDKTQLATAAMAAQANPIATWIGATGGMVAAGMIGAAAGQRIGDMISARSLRLASAGLFAVFGVLLLLSSW